MGLSFLFLLLSSAFFCFLSSVADSQQPCDCEEAASLHMLIDGFLKAFFFFFGAEFNDIYCIDLMGKRTPSKG